MVSLCFRVFVVESREQEKIMRGLRKREGGDNAVNQALSGD